MKKSELLATKYAQTMDNKNQLDEGQMKKVEEMKEKKNKPKTDLKKGKKKKRILLSKRQNKEK